MAYEPMRAAVITRPGTATVMEIHDVPRPVPQRHEVLVRVISSALNRADLLQRAGKYPPPPGASDIPGLEFAGQVEDFGESTSRWKKGDSVMGIVAGGAHAEYLTVHEDAIAAKPQSLSFVQAGCVPEVFITAFDALQQAQVKEGEYVLIHAAGSGVGLAAVQLAHRMKAIPFGTTRSGKKTDEVVAAGAAAVFCLHTDELDKLRGYADQYTYGNGFDVVFDLNGGPYLPASLDCLAHKGRIICIGTTAGGRTELHLGMILHKRATIMGTVMRARPVEEKIAVTRAFAEHVLPGFTNKELRVTVDSLFPLNHIVQAHERLESNQTVGKVALQIGQEP